MTKVKKGAQGVKGVKTATLATLNTTTKAPKAPRVERTPAEAMATRIGARIPTGRMTTGQATFLAGKAHDVGTAAVALGLTLADAVTFLLRPFTLSPEQAGKVARAADLARIARRGEMREGNGNGYFTKNATARLGWHDGVRGWTLAEAVPEIVNGLNGRVGSHVAIAASFPDATAADIR